MIVLYKKLKCFNRLYMNNTDVSNHYHTWDKIAEELEDDHDADKKGK